MSLSCAESYVHCQMLARKTAGNFYYSFLTLPREQFRAMCVLYAFMRVTDDLGDSDEPQLVRARDLGRWREKLLLALARTEFEHPVLPALADVVQRYGVPREYLEAVITGVEMDLGPVAFETFDQLRHYCYHVAGAVGLACIHLWGFHDPRAFEAAVDCGTAFQLTNILRDLQEDISRDRLYLPREDFERFNCDVREISGQSRSEAFQRLMQFEVSRAREYYARAETLYDYLDPAGKPILETMIRIYRGILDEIERCGYDVFTRRVRLSRLRKVFIAGSAIVRHKLRHCWMLVGGRGQSSSRSEQ